MRGTVNEMRNDKTTKILARSGYERAVWLRIFIRGTDLSQLADTAVAAALFRYVMASSLPPDPGSEEIHGKGASTLVDGPGEGTWHHPRRSGKEARGNLDGTSGKYMWMGWEGDGKEMGTRGGAVLSHPVAAHT